MDASSPAPLGLPRERRIKQGRDFARAKVQGRRLAQGCLILNWVDLLPTDLSRLGVITGRKIGHAVIRSRARRLLREAFRLNQYCLTKPVDLVLVARGSIVEKAFSEVETDFLLALKKARLIRADSEVSGVSEK
jgi:ribonuclease P protein component